MRVNNEQDLLSQSLSVSLIDRDPKAIANPAIVLPHVRRRQQYKHAKLPENFAINCSNKL